MLKRNNFLNILLNYFNPFLGKILMLHSVVNERSIITDNRLIEITPSFLEKTIKEYKREGFAFISIDDALSLHKKNIFNHAKYICFSLDDGYYDNLSIALPIFEKHQVPFTIYITTDFVDQKSFIWWYVLDDIIKNNVEIELKNGSIYKCSTIEQKNETFKQIKHELQKNSLIDEKFFFEYIHPRYKNTSFHQPKMLNWEDIGALQKSKLCTIGSHGVTHKSLTLTSTEDLFYELIQSKKIIEERTGIVIKHFAYPYGNVDIRVRKAVKKAGYLSGVKIDGGMQRKFQNPYSFKRLWLYES